MATPLSIRIYLASVPGEMDSERAVIEGLVLPELRERAQGLGIRIVVVDPAKVKEEEWDLAQRFRGIETCEIFIGLLGERYGEPPAAVPLTLVAAHPWLAEDPERSVVELEILQGTLREPGRRRASFISGIHGSPGWSPRRSGDGSFLRTKRRLPASPA